MKVSTLKAEVTVPLLPKTLALLIALVDNIYSGDRAKLIRMLASYYGVAL